MQARGLCCAHGGAVWDLHLTMFQCTWSRPLTHWGVILMLLHTSHWGRPSVRSPRARPRRAHERPLEPHMQVRGSCAGGAQGRLPLCPHGHSCSHGHRPRAWRVAVHNISGSGPLARPLPAKAGRDRERPARTRGQINCGYLSYRAVTTVPAPS